MQKLSSFAGGVRHGWDMQFNRNQQQHSQHHQHHDMPPRGGQNFQRNSSTSINNLPPNVPMSWCFNVPFKSDVEGPEGEKIVYASPGAKEKWCHPEGTPENTPVHQLPVHTQNLASLQKLCETMSEQVQVPIVASVSTGKGTSLAPVPGIQPILTNKVVVNVCLHGPNFENVRRVREHILNKVPITLGKAVVPVDRHLLFEEGSTEMKQQFIDHLNEIHERTKADIFVIDPVDKNEDGTLNTDAKEQLKFVIYGDMLTKENCKVRLLVAIDRLLNMCVDTMTIDLAHHSLICGRYRKKVKSIESATDTAIYFPPTFPGIHLYRPDGADRRPFDEIVITGPDLERIYHAKAQLKDLAFGLKAFGKEIRVTPTKMDHLLLDRLDKIQSIMESHGSYLLLPSIGHYTGLMRVQGLDVLNVERTIREIMALTTQFYSAEWQCNALGRNINEGQIQQILSDICASSGADVAFANNTFFAFGSDQACRTALGFISQIPFVKHSQSSIHVKLELAVEHKEFVSGKKNGKINKIMNTANVQIVFDGFNEYNFYIDVRSNEYHPVMYGLELVELELPASLSFHVPDQYHKRIIGIGGQHIQQLMKKYSVFVKFSNAHDRGPVMGKDDDTLKLDNVICRTPSRNAQNLELVKQEIMDMVNRPDAEQVTESVDIDRLVHRELIGCRMHEIEEVEKKWNCKIIFPSTEQAIDSVQVSGPEFQVPQCIHDLLAMVPETHDVTFKLTEEIKEYLDSTDFNTDIVEKLKQQHCVDLTKEKPQSQGHSSSPSQSSTQSPPAEPSPKTVPKADSPSEQASPSESQEDNAEMYTVTLNYTKNNEGGIKDAIDLLISKLEIMGLDPQSVKGAIPRPKSDSFEDNLQFFQSRLLHPKAPGTDSPTRSIFNDNDGQEASGSSSFFSKFRKPSSMASFSSLIDRRKNGTNSPSTAFFKHASSNASKASLASLESQGSGYRNIWNDSGINLPEDEIASTPLQNSHGWPLPVNHSQQSMSSTHLGHHAASGSAFPNFMFNNNSSSSLLMGNYPAPPTISHPGHAAPGDTTPTTSRYDPRASVDSGRPSTSHSLSGYPGPIGGLKR